MSVYTKACEVLPQNPLSPHVFFERGFACCNPVCLQSSQTAAVCTGAQLHGILPEEHGAGIVHKRGQKPPLFLQGDGES